MSASLTRQPATGPSTGAVSTPDQTPSSKQFRGKLVTIIVGSSKESFSIHKDLLVFYSDYFRAAFNGSFTEATEGRIELRDVELEVFQNFHSWLYTRKLLVDKIHSHNDESMSWGQLFDLWIFGDRFQVPLLQNCVMDEIIGRGDEISLKFIKVAYENTVAGSPLRRIMIEFLAYHTNLEGGDYGIMRAKDRKHLTVEMLQDLVVELNTARKNKVRYGKTPKRDKCFFHIHGKAETMIPQALSTFSIQRFIPPNIRQQILHLTPDTDGSDIQAQADQEQRREILELGVIKTGTVFLLPNEYTTSLCVKPCGLRSRPAVT
ncbi:hypothetical protein KCU65_g7599, partial [Aureobasidium melanogenum]